MSFRTQLLLLAILSFGCASRPSPQTAVDLSSVRAAQRELNYEPTANFERHSFRAGYRICYWAGPFELPDDYTGLRYREGKCPSRSEGQDVFFYEPEALAGRQTPVTRKLAAAEEHRRSFVAAHEDFHEQQGVRELEPARKEAFSTLAGLLTAAEAARIEHGADSAQYAAALREAEAFLEKSRAVNEAHAHLRQVYGALDRGEITQAEALRRKAAVFAELESRCDAIEPPPKAFARRPGVMNNAGLAFDATYTRFFPRAWSIYEAAGRDAAETIARLRALAAGA